MKQSSAAIFFILFFMSVSFADVLDELEIRQAKVKTVRAQFIQEKHTKLLSKPIKSSGSFLYKQPDKIRWNYKDDINIQVVYNGRKLHIYYPDSHEVDTFDGTTRYSSMMHFDVAHMSKGYDITGQKKNNTLKLKFVPKTKSPVSLIEMDIQEESAFPRTVKLTDTKGEVTIIMFKDIKINEDVSEDMFDFTHDSADNIRERAIK